MERQKPSKKNQIRLKNSIWNRYNVISVFNNKTFLYTGYKSGFFIAKWLLHSKQKMLKYLHKGE